MLVSVIIPCYNYANFLPEAVKSVLQQTYAEWECLIVNDGSPDNTEAVAKDLQKLDARIKYYLKPNGGLSSARNYGIAHAKGELICFLDADDLLDEKKLEAQVACFQKNNSADVVYGKAMFFENGDLSHLYANKQKDRASELATLSGQGDVMTGFLNKQNITVVSAPLIKTSVFAKVGNFDESYRSYEDWQFWARCAIAGCPFVYHNEPKVCTYIRFGHESMMSDKRKLLNAGIQLRRYLAGHLPLKFRAYNYYRLMRSRIKLLFT